MEARTKTPARILESALFLFNDLGEPNVTTNHVADELNMSPGNLHYHFRSKSDIVEALFARFDTEVSQLLIPDTKRTTLDVVSAWTQMQTLFEGMWSFRFVYRDLPQLLAKYPSTRRKTVRLMHRKIAVMQQGCEALGIGSGEGMDKGEAELLARNMVLAMTYWFNFEIACGIEGAQGDRFARGAYQVLSMLLPYLDAESRLAVRELAASYI